MDLKNIFVIVGRGYVKESVVEILKSDGYIHNFTFGCNFKKEDVKEWGKLILESDEVWIYGETNKDFKVSKWQHSFSLKNNVDVWRMG